MTEIVRPGTGYIELIKEKCFLDIAKGEKKNYEEVFSHVKDEKNIPESVLPMMDMGVLSPNVPEVIPYRRYNLSGLFTALMNNINAVPIKEYIGMLISLSAPETGYVLTADGDVIIKSKLRDTVKYFKPEHSKILADTLIQLINYKYQESRINKTGVFQTCGYGYMSELRGEDNVLFDGSVILDKLPLPLQSFANQIALWPWMYVIMDLFIPIDGMSSLEYLNSNKAITNWLFLMPVINSLGNITYSKNVNGSTTYSYRLFNFRSGVRQGLRTGVYPAVGLDKLSYNAVMMFTIMKGFKYLVNEDAEPDDVNEPISARHNILLLNTDDGLHANKVSNEVAINVQDKSVTDSVSEIICNGVSTTDTSELTSSMSEDSIQSRLFQQACYEQEVLSEEEKLKYNIAEIEEKNAEIEKAAAALPKVHAIQAKERTRLAQNQRDIDGYLSTIPT